MIIVTKTLAKSLLPRRPGDSNKGTFGRALLVCGSENMMGAAILAGTAAYSAGAGLIALSVPETEKHIIFTALPEAVFVPRAKISAFIKDKMPMVVLMGCGVGAAASKLLPKVLNAPLVLDGDGLNALSKTKIKFTLPTVLTPHPLEAARLSGLPLPKTPEERQKTALLIARKYNCICVLKGRHTLITDGAKIYENKTGSSSLAKAGTGDVLAGIISGFWAHGMAPLNAAVLGVYLHGAAGSIAGRELGNYSLLPSQLNQYISKAIKKLIC